MLLTGRDEFEASPKCVAAFSVMGMILKKMDINCRFYLFTGFLKGTGLKIVSDIAYYHESPITKLAGI